MAPMVGAFYTRMGMGGSMTDTPSLAPVLTDEERMAAYATAKVGGLQEEGK